MFSWDGCSGRIISSPFLFMLNGFDPFIKVLVRDHV